MRYALLGYVVCPVCRGELACFIARETPTSISSFVAERAPRSPIAGAAFAPGPTFRSSTLLTARLQALAGAPAPQRNREAVVGSGLLICGECARWFPIVDTLPELLPDHLRDPGRENPLFETLAASLPPDVRKMLRAPAADFHADETGAHYKRAEIGIASKVENFYQFFGPGFTAPFNPGNTEFTLYLLSLFGSVARLLEVDRTNNQNAVVIDSGCGYSWTTEWLAKSGVEAIGVDITRTYLDIGMKRIGESRPHLVVGDVENLPIRDNCAEGVLAFESFHHLPNRAATMSGYARVLREGGVAVLAEPGGAHEEADVSKDTMKRFGILEKGMEREDLEDYIAGEPFAPPERRYVLHVSSGDLQNGITEAAAWRYSDFHGHIFRIRKDTSVKAPKREGARPVVPAESRAPMDAMRQLDAELQRTIAEVRALKIDLRDARVAALDAAQKIAAMRRSAFWRAREAWVRLRGRVTGTRTSND
jgi:uncharacterized protein YbaR (Trm112 family)/SAM-dependent methyltransferase